MSYLKELSVSTRGRTEFVPITGLVEKAVKESGVKNGVCHVFVPHTTAGVTINENADRDVAEDIRKELDKLVPMDNNYCHSEGNSAAHIKSTLVGASVTVFISDGRLKLGTWQGIFFCEFDGPRERKVWVKIIEDRD
jgi:secondary thiamine-phosphate synthase enzyme